MVNFLTATDNPTPTAILKYGYGDDSHGMLEEVYDELVTPVQVRGYAYDSSHRLDVATSGLWDTIDYKSDLNGNRETKKVGPPATPVTTTYSYTDLARPNRLTGESTVGGDTVAYFYDAQGNRDGHLDQNQWGYGYAYDSAGQLDEPWTTGSRQQPGWGWFIVLIKHDHRGFQITKDEFESLKSQSVMSKPGGRGVRRSPLSAAPVGRGPGTSARQAREENGLLVVRRLQGEPCAVQGFS